MQVHYNIDQLPAFRNAVLTIGTFDGVHLGHRRIIDTLKKEAGLVDGESVIITFHPHPRAVISSGLPGIKLINTLEEKIELLDQLSIDHLVVVRFDIAFASQPAEKYIADFLVGRFHPHTIIVGYDHRFGKKRQGDFRLLGEKAPVYGFILKEIPQQVVDEIGISSTRIREAILKGDMDTANKLLGYDFFFEGEVVDGEKLGRQLGYPTANLESTNEAKIIPADGIYAVHVRVGEELYKGMMSIGYRPTVDGKKHVVEVNIFDFSADIYNSTVVVQVKKWLRAEAKFNSLEELVKQMDKDKEESLKLLA